MTVGKAGRRDRRTRSSTGSRPNIRLWRRPAGADARRLHAADLEAIGDYIAEDNPRRALAFVQELRDRCGRIALLPQAAPLRPELGEGVRVVTFGRYLICYVERDDGQVVIERIVHGSRNLAALF